MTPIKLNITFDIPDIEALELISRVLEKNNLSFEQAVTLLYEVTLLDPDFVSKLVKNKG